MEFTKEEFHGHVDTLFARLKVAFEELAKHNDPGKISVAYSAKRDELAVKVMGVGTYKFYIEDDDSKQYVYL